MAGARWNYDDEVEPVVDGRAWAPSSWRGFPASQQPNWESSARAEQVLGELGTVPALVFAGECRQLVRELGAVSRGEAFLLQGGDCAESFHEFTAPEIREKLRVLLQMTVVLAYGAGVPVVKVARMAGQYAKPRSSEVEERDGVSLASFRGHMVNGEAFDARSRAHDAGRMLEAYWRSASTLNLLRAFTRGGFASLERVQGWNQEFVASSPQGERFAQLAGNITDALAFMRACGVQTHGQELAEAEMYTSHEALVLEYEQALCRRDSLTGIWYDTSAHMLWIGERTRALDGAHVEFCRGVSNPLGVKLGPTASGEEVVALCEALNPLRVAGRLVLVSRMGSDAVREVLPELVEAVERSGHPVVWSCDPMHGNTVSAGGYKTRRFEAVLDEVQGFFEVHRRLRTVPGGVHIELTGGDVTECLGGADALGEHELARRYETVCDPRLNARQSIELAFSLAESLTADRAGAQYGDTGGAVRGATDGRDRGAPWGAVGGAGAPGSTGRWVRDDESGEVSWFPV